MTQKLVDGRKDRETGENMKVERQIAREIDRFTDR